MKSLIERLPKYIIHDDIKYTLNVWVSLYNNRLCVGYRNKKANDEFLVAVILYHINIKIGDDNIGYATNFNKALKMLRNYIKCQEKSKVNIVEI